MYNIHFDTNEANALGQLLDIALKSGGLNVVDAVYVWKQKLITSLQVAETSAQESN